MASKGRIPPEIIDEIRDRVSIERVIGEYVQLKRRGRNFTGLCPFHQEKTPSFSVNTERQIFKCFGCGESGNVFSFLMKFENITFPEAVERMAEQTGIVLPEVHRESPVERSEKDGLLALLKKAWSCYHHYLLQSPNALEARNYLETRGYGIEEIKRYGLGYAPDQWDFIIKEINVPINQLIQSGLVINKESSSKCYDRFRNRVMFPIREHRRGDVVAFGGRTLGDDPAKYINSPESPVYNKSRILYGLYEAAKAIRSNREVILVEGYFDRLALDRHGIHNVVAPCGTSLTEQQVNLIKRSAQTLYLLFDADPAGVSAAIRALELSLGSGIETLAVPLPDGMDPDDLVNAEKADGIMDLVKTAQPALDFMILSATRRHDTTRSAGRRQVVEEMIPFLLDVSNTIDRGSYITRIADLVRVPAESVLELLKRRHLRNLRARQKNETLSPDSKVQAKTFVLEILDKDLFCFFILHPEYINWDENPIIPEAMHTPAAIKIYELLRADMHSHGNISVSRILDQVSHPGLNKLLVDLFDDPGLGKKLIHEDPAVLFQGFVQEYNTRKLKSELELIRKRLLLNALSDSETEELLARQVHILESLNTNKMS